MQENETEAPVEQVQEEVNLMRTVAEKIAESQNILVALSADPSVDEMAAAIGLSIYLDKIGKHVAAIYSGVTPNALEFLNPDETFEDSADILQDFVIALNKEKADHLRYKLDGDYVKIFITPYKSKIVEDDLEYSYGDYNVDLVLALDVANGVDLDAALREHGRIMHDAVIVNITTGNPGKLGEIEWSDKKSSSVSEMIAGLVYAISGKVPVEKEEATAFLTGIVAATNRFSGANTSSETMNMASKLMNSGANQQLVSKNITPDIDNEMFSLGGNVSKKAKSDDVTNLSIEHGLEEADVDETQEVNATVNEKESTLLDDLKAAEANLAMAGAEIVPDEKQQPLTIRDNEEVREAQPAVETQPVVTPVEPLAIESAPVKEEDDTQSETVAQPVSVKEEDGAQSETVVQPLNNFTGESLDEGTNKYGQMLEEALNGDGDTQNLATASAPVVSSEPEINGVPEMSYEPVAEEGVLPPPPAPVINMDNEMQMAMPPAMPAIEHAEPVLEPAPEPLGAQPAMQDQVYNPAANDPGAFQIPGSF